MQKVKMNINAFFGDDDIEVSFPDNWDVQQCLMTGHDKPRLSDEEMRHALHNPIGAPRLSELAKGKKEVCILFDDIPKPTQAGDIARFVLEELHAGGITDEQIRFLCAPGTHRPLTYPEFAAKLGRDIVERYPVYNHSIWDNLVHVGETGRGTPVHVNREYAACDLRVARGSIFPHGLSGFGGGGKIILPGVCGIETIEYHHRNMLENAALDRVDDNVFRLDIEDAARISGLHFKVDAVINNHREVVGLFAGDLVEEHRAGVKLARELYKAKIAKDADVVVANSYPDESQLVRAMWCVPLSLKEGGDAVLISHSFDGQNLHQLGSRFGTDFGGHMYKPNSLSQNMERAGRTIVMSPIMSRYDMQDIGPSEKVIWCKTWDDVLAELGNRNGSGTKVAVYPYAPLQMPA